MLSMAAGQIGNPIAIVILVIPNDRLLHAVMIRLSQEARWYRRTTIGPLLSFLQRFSRSEPISMFLKRPFGPLNGRKICPSLFFILIEASYKYHVAIKMAKLSEVCSAVLWIDGTCIILPDHIDTPR